MLSFDDQEADIMDRWLASNSTARLSGLDLRPMPHRVFPGLAYRVTKGQGTVFFLEQYTHRNVWLLKKFAASRRPSDAYLESVTDYLPGGAAFFTCSQRRILRAGHMDRTRSDFRDERLALYLEGTILMPKAPGMSWSSVADDLRNGEVTMTLLQRLQIALNLVTYVEALEEANCSHRDFSGFNIHLTRNGRLYVIDWDSLCHPELPFQPNTTSGTMGYMPPFLRDPSGSWDAARSWRPHADRFAMAILITEFLLIGPHTPAPHEDGSLFSQSQLNDSDNSLVRDQVQRLRRLSKGVANLFERALGVASFDVCPSPEQWRSALRRALRLEEARRDTGESPASFRRRVKHACSVCGGAAWIDEARSHELEVRQKEVLCNSCLEDQLRACSRQKARHDQTHPAVICEHCLRSFRVLRSRLDLLRVKGKPILCPSCLKKQLRTWEAERAEYDFKYPIGSCTQCEKSFRLRREKLETLIAKGKLLLCRECLSHHLAARQKQRLLRSAANAGTTPFGMRIA